MQKNQHLYLVKSYLQAQTTFMPQPSKVEDSHFCPCIQGRR